MVFLKKRLKLTLDFNPSFPRIDESMFEQNNREQFLDLYRDVKEEAYLGPLTDLVGVGKKC